MANYSIRPIEKKDIEQIANLHLEIFGNRHNRDILIRNFHWKYYENPQGNVFGRVATDAKENIVGVYAGIPLTLKVNKEDTTAYFIVNKMVKDTARKEGLFTELYYEVHENLAKEKNASLVLGYPNLLSLKIGTKSLEFRHLLKLHRYEFSIRSYNFEVNRSLENSILKSILNLVEKGFRKLNRTRSYLNRKINPEFSVKRTEGIPGDITPMLKYAEADYPICFKRTAENISWRILKNPEPNIYLYEVRLKNELVGIFALKEERVTSVIDFFFVKDKVTIEEIVYMIAREASKNKECEYIELAVYNIAMENFLIRNGARSTNITALCYFPLGEQYNRITEQVSKSDLWYLTGSEFIIG